MVLRRPFRGDETEQDAVPPCIDAERHCHLPSGVSYARGTCEHRDNHSQQFGRLLCWSAAGKRNLLPLHGNWQTSGRLSETCRRSLPLIQSGVKDETIGNGTCWIQGSN